MKIGMMCLWNAANGPSIHAELVGRAWIDLGHQLTVFSAQKHPDARPTHQVDEDFVIRHFSVDKVVPVTRAASFDPTPPLKEDYEVFVAQNVERMPADSLFNIFSKIQQKAVTVQVVHEGKAPDDPLYHQFRWDATVCFDQRYKDFLVQSFPSETIHMISYPYYPRAFGDQREAREKLGLPLEKMIIFSFGFRTKDIMAVLPTLKTVAREYSLKYLAVTNPESDVEVLRQAQKEYDFLVLQVEPLPLDKLYTYLHASDVHLIHRESTQKYKAVVSSTVCQTLGSGCPILFHESNYVELHGDEIVKYRDFNDMKIKLVNLFEGKFDHRKLETFLEEHKAQRVAEKFIRLFEDLLRRKRK